MNSKAKALVSKLLGEAVESKRAGDTANLAWHWVSDKEALWAADQMKVSGIEGLPGGAHRGLVGYDAMGKPVVFAAVLGNTVTDVMDATRGAKLSPANRAEFIEIEDKLFLDAGPAALKRL